MPKLLRVWLSKFLEKCKIIGKWCYDWRKKIREHVSKMEKEHSASITEESKQKLSEIDMKVKEYQEYVTKQEDVIAAVKALLKEPDESAFLKVGDSVWEAYMQFLAQFVYESYLYTYRSGGGFFFVCLFCFVLFCFCLFFCFVLFCCCFFYCFCFCFLNFSMWCNITSNFLLE